MLEISAILPTRNRAHLLPFVFDALRRQSLPKSQFEVIAVDDGSTDNTQDVLKREGADLSLKIFHQRHAGLAAAKNLGIFASRSPILLFLDDDDVAAPGLLEAHVRTHKTYPRDEIAVLGYTGLSSEVARSPLMRHVTEVGCQQFSYGWMKPGMELGYTEFWGGRSSCKRNLLMVRGIFNPIFAFGYEDIELGWRLAQFGLRVIYEPSAASTMIRTLTFRDFCARQQRQGRSQRIFATLHAAPEIRSYCEIDTGLAEWKRNAGRFTQYLRWVERLDHTAAVYARAGLPIDPLLQRTLDDAYRAAFAMCRAKGLASDVADDDSATKSPHVKYATNAGSDSDLRQIAADGASAFEPVASPDTTPAIVLDRRQAKNGPANAPQQEATFAAKPIVKSTAPKATVVICTYNRYQYLAELLPNLDSQNVDFAFEVLVVDNSDDELAKAEFYNSTSLPRSVRVVPSFPPGLSRARNIGLQVAEGQYVAFIDDDTVPGPGWLQAIVDTFEEHGDAAVVGGPISPIWPIDRPEWVPRKYEDALTIINLGHEQRELKYEYLYGANICFRVNALRSIGGFREHLGRQGAVALLGNEELQVQDELRKKGYSIWYAPKGGLSHHVHQGRIDRGWFRRRMTWQAVSDALTMDGLSDIKQGLDFVISAADRIGIDRSFLNCLVDSNDPEIMQAQLEFLRGLTTLALSTNANIFEDETVQLTQSVKAERIEQTGPATVVGTHSGKGLGEALNSQREGVVFFEATPGHEFLFDTFSELKDASLFTRQLNPWAEDEDGIKKLFEFLDLGLRKASERSSAITFLTLDYWERPYLPIGDVVARGFRQRVSESGIPAFAFLHRYFTDPGGIQRLQYIAPALQKVLVFSPDMKRDLERNLGLTNVDYVPLPAMIENFPAGDCAAIRARLSIPDDRVVVSMLGEARKGKGYNIVLDALAQLDPITKQKAFFLFGGKGSPELREAVLDCLNENELSGLADLRVISDKRQYVVLTDSEFSDYIQASDVGLLIYREDQRYGMSGVLPNYIVAGKPVIATADSYVGKLVSKHGLGWVLLEESPSELAKSIAEAVSLAHNTRLGEAVAKYRPETEKRAVLARLRKVFECR